MKRAIGVTTFVFCLFTIGRLGAAEGDRVTFNLVPNPAFKPCLANPGSLNGPSAHVTVVRGKLNDTLIVATENLKPGIGLDLFTVQNSFFQQDGTKDPNFNGIFGLAWYQSDVQVSAQGKSSVTIQTILLDQIFGFDPTHLLPPTNAFHVGLWFDDPQDAAACGFDVTRPTPFNGQHKAGPMAMMSVPTASKLGPLCLNPQVSGNTVTCKP